MATLDFDFSHAPPKQGGGITLVPPGPYVLRVVGADTGQSSSGNQMVSVDFVIDEGGHAGEELTDYFSPVPPRVGDKLNGLQKFHAFLIGLGFKMQSGKVKLDLEKLVGRRCTANIATDQMQATAQYPTPRDVSKIRSYEPASPVTSPARTNGNSGMPNVVSAGRPLAALPEAPQAAATAVAEAPTTVEDGISVDTDGDLFE